VSCLFLFFFFFILGEEKIGKCNGSGGFFEKN
jgi:hypothetical protein